MGGGVALELNSIETHGTGTSLGDPIEVGALGRVLDKLHGRGGAAAAHSSRAAPQPPPTACGQRTAPPSHSSAHAASLTRPSLPLSQTARSSTKYVSRSTNRRCGHRGGGDLGAAEYAAPPRPTSPRR